MKHACMRRHMDIGRAANQETSALIIDCLVYKRLPYIDRVVNNKIPKIEICIRFRKMKYNTIYYDKAGM